MSLPRIPSDKPHVKPATEEKIYPDKYITGMSIGTVAPGRQPCLVALQAYNYDTKELSDNPDTIERFRIPNLWTEVARSPVVAQAVEGLVTVIFLMYQEKVLWTKLQQMEDGPERDAVISQFQKIQSQLQVKLSTLPDPWEDKVVWSTDSDPTATNDDPPE